MYSLLLMLMLMQIDVPPEPIPLPILPFFEVQVEAYPQEEVAFGDIVFLRYKYKNVSGRPWILPYGYGLFKFGLYADVNGRETLVWRYVKDGAFGQGIRVGISPDSVLLQPDETFTVYEAVLVPSPARDFLSFRMEPFWDISEISECEELFLLGLRPIDRNKPHPFWNFPENSKKKYRIDANFHSLWHQERFQYSPARRTPVVVVSRPAKEMQFLKNWFDKRLGPTKWDEYGFGEIVLNPSVYAVVDPILPMAFKDVTPEGKQEILDNLSSGTFRDLIQLHASLGLGSMEGDLDEWPPTKALYAVLGLGLMAEGDPDKLFIDSYQSPDEKFWAWFDNLPEIQRHFFAIAVVKAYCSRILAPFPEWVTLPEYSSALMFPSQEGIQKELQRAKAEYANRRDQYDHVIADWLPRLPQEPGEGREIIRLFQRLQKPEEPSP